MVLTVRYNPDTNLFFVNLAGLPLDTTDEEFVEMMSKYGIIMQDPDTSM